MSRKLRLSALVASVILVALPCHSLRAQQKSNLVASMHDLELGMPRDTVLAGLVAVGCKLDNLPESDIWFVRSGEVYLGSVVFRGGKLDDATVRLQDGGAASDVVTKLFEAIFDQSGQSKIKEEPGQVSRTRQTSVVVESDERTYSTIKTTVKVLKIVVGLKQFNLTVTDDSSGTAPHRTVVLDELIVKKWQTGGNKTTGK